MAIHDVIGIGVDLVEVDRMRDAISRTPSLVERLFSELLPLADRAGVELECVWPPAGVRRRARTAPERDDVDAVEPLDAADADGSVGAAEAEPVFAALVPPS